MNGIKDDACFTQAAQFLINGMFCSTDPGTSGCLKIKLSYGIHCVGCY